MFNNNSSRQLEAQVAFMRIRRDFVTSITAMPLVLAQTAVSTAQEFDPVQHGRSLVQMYCADCHATGTTGESPLPVAPRFRDLHLRYNVELLEEALVEGIVTHPQMPEFEFDPEQAQGIIEYLKSLTSAASKASSGGKK